MYINIRYTALNIIALAQNLGFGLNSLLRIGPLLRLTPMVAFVTSGKVLLWSAVFM